MRMSGHALGGLNFKLTGFGDRHDLDLVVLASILSFRRVLRPEALLISVDRSGRL